MTLETVSEAHLRLAAAGFGDQLRAQGNELANTATCDTFDPASLQVVEIARFEGDSDPDDEAMVLAIADADGHPLGTMTTGYGPNVTREEAEVLLHLHRVHVSADERAAHDDHDHLVAIFPGSSSAEAAVDELREVGLGSEHLGAAVHNRQPVAFERDEEHDLAIDVGAGTATGAVIGLVSGMLIFGLAAPGIGTLGVGGILAMGAATGIGGAMLGGYAGVAASSQDLDEHERLRHIPLEPGEVMVVACSHDHPDTVTHIMQRHGGRLLPTNNR